MEVTYASQAAPGVPNEDFIAAGSTFVVVLDGATMPKDVKSGCIHDVSWFVRQLGGSLATLCSEPSRTSLTTILRGSIEHTCKQHAASCDLTNPDSPSSTVAILRAQDENVDYLVLCDSPIVLELRTGEVRPVIDDRTSRLPSYGVSTIRQYRNTPGGFWVASTKPEAADHSLTGSLQRRDLRRAALLTDGASRLVERYGRNWTQLLDLLDQAGPQQLISQVRVAESHTAKGQYRGKHHDDATVALCRFPSHA